MRVPAKGFTLLNGRAGAVLRRYTSMLLIVAAAVATRAVTLGNPILYSDEEFYFAFARAMTNGALPYVDIWDRKPIGLFLLYLLPASAPWPLGIWLYQLAALAFAAITALLVAHLARRAGWSRVALPAAIAYLAWLTIAGGQGGQSPVFYNALMAAAAALIVADEKRSWQWHAPAAMLLVGLALQVKYSVVFEGCFFGCWLVIRAWQRHRSVARALLRAVTLITIALAPTALAFALYAAKGHIDAFVFANFLSILERKSDPFRDVALNFAIDAVILLPLLLMAVRSRAGGIGGNTLSRVFLAGWLIVALLGFLAIPPWPDHYLLPVILPTAVAAAGYLSRPDRRLTGIAAITLAALVGQGTLIVDRARRGTPAQFDAIVAAVGRGAGCLYVYSSTSMLYPATGRCAASRYVFPSHLTRKREAGTIGTDQATELRRLFANGPSVVVMAPPHHGERLDIRALVLDQLAHNYHLIKKLPLGRKQISIYGRLATRDEAIALSRFD